MYRRYESTSSYLEHPKLHDGRQTEGHGLFVFEGENDPLHQGFNPCVHDGPNVNHDGGGVDVRGVNPGDPQVGALISVILVNLVDQILDIVDSVLY
ncbi:hypothetical protein OJ252_3729 [Cryptosporidium canis]|uniref:Uncharacterized protein n=1 Tax=Cryptosporidium canis TaxID=195482 RepID=A0ABQ8P1G2_9CRYT|nr:hypothetical protein OJ252_3729 [Cryptosporidium canis]